jgi:hypothetical protein
MSNNSLLEVQKKISEIEKAIRERDLNRGITAYNTLRIYSSDPTIDFQTKKLAHDKGIELHVILVQMRQEILQNEKVQTANVREPQPTYADPMPLGKTSKSFSEGINFKTIIFVIVILGFIISGTVIFMKGNSAGGCAVDGPFACKETALKASASTNSLGQNYVILKMDQSKGIITNVNISDLSESLKECDKVYIDRAYSLATNYEEVKIMFDCKNITLSEVAVAITLSYKLDGMEQTSTLQLSTIQSAINTEVKETLNINTTEDTSTPVNNITNINSNTNVTRTNTTNTTRTNTTTPVISGGFGGGGGGGGSTPVYTVDRTPPTTSFDEDYPVVTETLNAGGTTFNVTFKASAHASGASTNTIDSMVIYIDSNSITCTNVSDKHTPSCIVIYACPISKMGGGTITYSVIAVDGGNGEESDEVHYTYNVPDFIVPVTTISTSNTVNVTSTPTIITGTASDNYRLSYVEYRINNGSWHNVTGNTTWNISANVRNGTNYVEVRAKDSFNKTNSTIKLFNVTLRPELQLTIYNDSLTNNWNISSQNGTFNVSDTTTIYNGTFSINFTGSNSSVLSIEYFSGVDSQFFPNIDGYQSIQFRVNGSINDSMIIRLTGDNITGFSDINISNVTGANFTGEWMLVQLNITAINPNRIPIKKIEFIPITYSALENTTIYIDDLVFVGKITDNTTPQLNIIYPINEYIINTTSIYGLNILMTGNTTDDTYIENVTIVSNASSNTTTYATILNHNTSSINLSHNWNATIHLVEGINSINITSRDIAGNIITTNINITLNVQYLFGGIHMVHTTRSDGALSPDERVDAFKNVFDWVSQTDHDYIATFTELDQSEWTDMIAEANGNNTDNNFTYFFGVEWSASQHIAYMLINPPATFETNNNETLDTVQELAAWIVANNGVAQHNHPARASTGTDFSNPENYNETAIPLIAMIGQTGGVTYTWQWNYYFNCSDDSGCTTYNNPKITGLTDDTGTGWVKYALDLGLHLGFTGETDYHGAAPYEPQAMTGLVNPTNWTREGIIDALRRRHTWASENKTIMRLDVSNGSQTFTMGDIFSYNSNNSNISINYSIYATSGHNISNVSLYYKGIIVNVTTFVDQQNVSGTFIQNLTNNVEEYMFIEAIQSNGQRAWTSPIWVTYIPTG